MKRYKVRLAALFILFVFKGISVVPAQDIPGRLDSLFTTLANNHEFNGNVLIAEKGRIIYKHSFGLADAERRLPNTEQTAFHLASVSKIFTAVAILQLKQQGKLKLDDPFVKYFPEFPWPRITIRHLLSHTSGLLDYQIFEGPFQENPARLYTNNDLMAAFKADKQGLLFEAGEKYSYSNTGYGLLALLVEKISHSTFETYLSKHIFKPSGMNHTYIQTPQIKVDDASRAKRYEFLSYDPAQLKIIDSVQSAYIPAFVLGGIIGPAGMVSTVNDLLKFDQALYSNKLLKQTTLAEAFTPTKLNDGSMALAGWANTLSYYGLGWQILCDSTYGKVVWHGGGSPGSVTIFLRNISRKQTVIALDNVTHRGMHPQGANAFYLLNNGPLFKGKKSLAVTYVTELHKKGAEAAAVAFTQHRMDSINYYLDEYDFNRLGHDLLGDGFLPEALDVFRLNCFLFPLSFNVYDSYADALNRQGKKDYAIKMYQKSMELNPQNEGGKKVLESLLNDKR